MSDDPKITPLAEAAPESLDELFSRDPLKLQQQDIRNIINQLRDQRARWRAAEASGATRAPKLKSTSPKKAVGTSSLEDLGL